MDTMKTASRSPLIVPVLLLLLCLCSSAAFADRDDVDAAGEGRGGSGRPYHFGEESFRHWTRTRQGRFRVLERFADELLEGPVGRYRVAVLEAAPRAFLQPSHYDADEVMYVREGEGVVVLLHRGRRQSLCVREGDVMVIPAGAVVYSANTHSSDWFRVVMLLSPVSTPGRFQEFFPVGGERPESFFSVFSDDVIQAAFNTRREEWEQVFEKQRKGEITTASEEQIRELSRSCSRGGGGGSGSSEWEIKPSSLTGTKPRHSNNHGRHYEISGDECPHLRARNMDVSLANITHGSMMAPSYSTRANKIAVVVQGSGYFEMACPHLSSSGRSQQRRERERERERGRRSEEWGKEEEEEEEGHEEREQEKSRSYRQVRSRIQVGSVIVIPAGHPTVLVAGQDENLAVLCFGVHAGFDDKVFLAGRNSPLRQMDEHDKALAFGAAARDVDRVLGAQTESVFFRGPQSRSLSSA